MQQLSGKKTGDVITAAGAWEQFTKELENLALRRGVALDGTDLTQVLKAVQWGEAVLIDESTGGGATYDLGSVGVTVLWPTYDRLVLQLINMSPTTDGAYLTILAGTDAFYTTAYYNFSGICTVPAGPVVTAFSGGANHTAGNLMPDSGNTQGDQSDECAHGTFEIVPVAYFSAFGQLMWGNTSGVICHASVGGSWIVAGTLTAVRLLYSAGNIDNGSIARLWGLPKGS